MTTYMFIVLLCSLATRIRGDPAGIGQAAAASPGQDGYDPHVNSFKIIHQTESPPPPYKAKDRLSYARDGYPFWPEADAAMDTPPPLYVNRTEYVPPFTSIHACLPFIFVIAPAPPTTYVIKIDGERAVQNAINYVVEAGTLVLSTVASFNTSGLVKLTVYLPSNALQALIVSSIGDVILLPGFTPPALTITSGFGSGDVYALGLDTQKLVVEVTGTANLAIYGAIGDASITAGGRTIVYLMTVNGSANVNLDEGAIVEIGTLPDVTISGVALGVNIVGHTGGSCNVTSPLFGPLEPCVLMETFDVIKIEPKWTCGVAVEGSFTCPAGGIAAVRQDATGGSNVRRRLQEFTTATPLGPSPRRLRSQTTPSRTGGTGLSAGTAAGYEAGMAVFVNWNSALLVTMPCVTYQLDRAILGSRPFQPPGLPAWGSPRSAPPTSGEYRMYVTRGGYPFSEEAEATRSGPGPVYANRTESLPPYTTIQACLPFNFAVAPSPPGSYAITSVGGEDVLDAISYIVEADTLVLSTDANFNTTGGVKLTVCLPKDALRGVFVSSVGDVTILPGFSTAATTISSAFGYGDVYALGFDTQNLATEMFGTGTIFVSGVIDNASITAGGTSETYIKTVNGSVNVNLDETAIVQIDATAGVPITGSAVGPNTIAYTGGGNCSVESPFSAVRDPCMPMTQLEEPSVEPAWTCGLALVGNFTCPAGGISAVRQEATGGVAVRRRLQEFSTATPLGPIQRRARTHTRPYLMGTVGLSVGTANQLRPGSAIVGNWNSAILVSLPCASNTSYLGIMQNLDGL